MNILIIYPVETYATFDLAEGLYNGFKQTGHNVFAFKTGIQLASKQKLLTAFSQLHGNKITIDPNDLASEGLFDLIVLNDIELVISVRGFFPAVEAIDKCKKLGIKTAIYLTDDPYDYKLMENIVSHYDYIFTNDRIGTQINPKAIYVPVGYDDTIFKNQNLIKCYDISFIGSYFKERVEFFENIYEYITTKAHCFAGFWINKHDVKELSDFGSDMDSPVYKLIGETRVITPEDVNVIYNLSKIMPNPHRTKEWLGNDIYEPTNLNPRVFEIAGAKQFQLVSENRKETLSELFNDEIITYDSPNDFIEKCDYYLTHEDERMKLAELAYLNVIKNHTYFHRAQQILQHIT